MSYSLASIQIGIKIRKLKQLLESGENDMFDNPIDKKAIEKEIEELQKLYDEGEK